MSGQMNSTDDCGESTKIEYAVEMKCNSCKNRIEKTLKPLNGVTIVNIDVPQQKLIIKLDKNSDKTVHDIQSLIESDAGIRTVIKGIGENVATVSEIWGFDDVTGVVRMTQLVNRHCLIDGIIDGIRKQKDYSLNIHEYGDLSGEKFENVGNVMIPLLKQFCANDNSYPSRASFKFQIGNCDLNSCIGRSMALSHERKVIGAGIVARASNVNDNSKKICACSGKTLWDERTEKREDRTSRL